MAQSWRSGGGGIMELLKIALSALLVAGCASSLDYHECNTNDDCASHASDAGKLYCTNDHFCVLGVPDEQLCDDSQTLGTDGPGTLVLGVLTDHSDPNDQAIAKAVQLAASEIIPNQGGGAQPPLAVHFCDTAKDPAQALRAATRAVEFFHAAALIGPTTSDDVLKIAAYAAQTRTLVVSPSATAANISSFMDKNEVWRTCPSDSLQGVLLAKMVQAAAKGNMGASTIGSLHVTSIYGTGLSQTFVEEYQSLDKANKVQVFPFVTSTDLPMAMSSLGKITPTQALLVADMDAPTMVGMLGTTHGLEKTQFFMTDAAKGPGLFGAMGTTNSDVLKRIQGTSPSDPAGSVFDTFRTSYKGAFHSDPKMISFVANAYDATYVVAIAAAATTGRVPTGMDLAMGMAKLTNKGVAVPVGSMTYLAAVKQMSMGGVRIVGASGPMEFDANGDLTSASYDCWSVDTSAMPTFVIKSSPCPSFP